MKNKISYKEFLDLIYQIGLNDYNFLISQLNSNLVYNRTIFFVIYLTMTSVLVNNLIDLSKYKFNEDINKIIYLAFKNSTEEEKNSIILYQLYILDELQEIIKNLDFENLSLYILNEITEDKLEKNNEYNILIQYLSNHLSEYFLTLKKILKKIKII